YRALIPRLRPAKWYAWVPDQHFWHFTPRGLGHVVRSAGGAVAAVEYSRLDHPDNVLTRLTDWFPRLGDQFHLLARLPAAPACALTAADWATARAAPPGTVIEFARVELLPGAKTYFRHSAADAGQRFPYGYADDGAAHDGSPIHSPRVPVPVGAPRLALSET